MLTSFAHASFIRILLISCVFRLQKTCARKIHEHTRATKIYWAGLGTRLIRVKNSYHLVLHGALIVFVRRQPVTHARMPTQMDVQTIAQTACEMEAIALHTAYRAAPISAPNETSKYPAPSFPHPFLFQPEHRRLEHRDAPETGGSFRRVPALVRNELRKRQNA